MQATGLVKHHQGAAAVDGLDLVVDRGEVVALLGPAGAGKSTALDLLLGLTRPDAGTVELFGQTPAQAIRASRVCAMLQEDTLLDDVAVRDVVALAAALHPRPLPVDEALRRAGVDHVADQRGTRLSGAQRQRVRFAVALVGDPELLVLDEPTSAMDAGYRRAFWEMMRLHTDRSRTVLFATHHLDEAEEFADRVVMMLDGRVLADGPVSEVKAAASGRVLAAVVPDGQLCELLALPGVLDGSQRGDRFELKCADGDAPLQALLAMYPLARDIEVTSMPLDEAFWLLAQDADEGPR